MGSYWSKSRTIERDGNDKRTVGALAYFYVGGTTTPLAVYQDAAEATPHTAPVHADGYGRWPSVFIPFTASFDVQVTTAGGTQLYYDTLIPNPDPVQAAENTVDPNQLLQTGDWIFSPKTGTRNGFVRANGRTIGSALSGATERANADCADLYAFNWNNFADAILPVSGGRGASASADFAANKPIANFDCRSGFPIGVDDMGNTAAGRAASIPYTNGDATTGGSHCGENTHSLTADQLGAHGHSINLSTSTDGSHTHSGTTDAGGSHNHTFAGDALAPHAHTLPSGAISGGHNGTLTADSAATLENQTTTSVSAGTPTGTISTASAHTHAFGMSANGSHSHTVSGATGTVGSGAGHNSVTYAVSGNLLIKL